MQLLTRDEIEMEKLLEDLRRGMAKARDAMDVADASMSEAEDLLIKLNDERLKLEKVK